MASATVHLAAIGRSTTMHHVVAPKPLRGEITEVRTRCGRAGEPKVLVKSIDRRAVRVREGVVCVTCIDLNGGIE